MHNYTRRSFLKASTALSATVVLSTPLTGCQHIKKSALTQVEFTHGVASGDPTQTAVILWTRAIAADGNQATIGWQVAGDADFKQVIRSGTATTSAQQDFTCKVDVTGLEPDTPYYYRFFAAGQRSVSGLTKTLPQGDINKVTLAVFSCSNYPAGFFNPYTEAAKRNDIDVVLHLGDYIYEYASDGYATENAQKIGRTLAPDNQSETISLEDYRKRYALYRTDKGLLALHAKVPFIAVWDDHEITNDTYKEGAENHSPDEGDFFLRRARAIQAYYEWMPIRPPRGETEPHIYRAFRFGNLADLIMLDTRVIGRDKQLNYKDYRSEAGFDAQRFMADVASPQRTLLGQEQLQWVQQQIQTSNARWLVLGQQILMGKMLFPAEVFANEDRSKIGAAILELSQLKQRLLANQPISEQDAKRLQQVMAYNLDAWDGYPVEREALYAMLKQAHKPAVVLAGDTHNAWCNQLRDQQGNQVGIEFATPGVSSPGIEAYLSLNPQQAEYVAKSLTLLIDHLQYCNVHQRGYMRVQISKDAVNAEWTFVDTVLSPDYQVAGSHSYRFDYPTI